MTEQQGQVPDQIWDLMKEHLGYSDEEMELFRRDPSNERVLAVAADMPDKTIVFEVVESHGCNSGHTVGTRFFFSADGNLLTRMAPSRVCGLAVQSMATMINSMQEVWYAGGDPNEICFARLGCPDVGVRAGGWGHIVMQGTVMDRAQAKRLHEESLPRSDRTASEV